MVARENTIITRQGQAHGHEVWRHYGHAGMCAYCSRSCCQPAGQGGWHRGRAAGLQAAGLPWQAGRRPLQGKQASQGKGLAGELGGGRHTSALLRLEAPPRACCLRWKQLVGGLAGELAGIYSAYNIQHNFAI